MKKFLTTTALMFVSRGFDMYTTFLYIPDLQGETNVLVRLLGLGWTGSILIQLAALFFLTYAATGYYFKKVETGEVERNTSLSAFISLFHFNRPDAFTQLLYRLPTNKNSMLYSIGGIVPHGLTIIGFAVGASTSMLIFSEFYESFYRALHLPVLIYIGIATLMVVLAIRFYRREREERSQIYDF